MADAFASPEQFDKWVDEMIAAGLAKSRSECGRLLGKSTDTMWRIRKNGTDQTTALAMAALLHRMSPYQ